MHGRCRHLSWQEQDHLDDGSSCSPQGLSQSAVLQPPLQKLISLQVTLLLLGSPLAGIAVASGSLCHTRVYPRAGGGEDKSARHTAQMAMISPAIGGTLRNIGLALL